MAAKKSGGRGGYGGSHWDKMFPDDKKPKEPKPPKKPKEPKKPKSGVFTGWPK